MRSQSLFNFFTKSADTYKSAAAPGQNQPFNGVGGPQSGGKPKPAYDPAQLKKTVDSDYAVYDSMYGAGAGDTGSTRLAYSNYMGSLARAYARGSITRDDYYARRDYLRDRLATEQFDDMYNAYHTWTNRDDYGDKAQDPGRMNMAMVDDTNRRRYIFKRGAGSPANMTYAQFRDNFIIDPKTGKPISKDEARLKWNSMWQRSAGGSVPGSGSPQDDSWRSRGYQQRYAAEDAYKANKKAVDADNQNKPATPLTFQGGYTVNYDPRYVKDWSRANDTTNNNVGGTWYTDEQYLAYEDISKQLRQSMTESGMDPTKARAEASRLAKAYINDQMEIAAAGNDPKAAKYTWREQPAAPKKPAAETPAAPAETPAAPVETPAAPAETPAAPVETPAAPAVTEQPATTEEPAAAALTPKVVGRPAAHVPTKENKADENPPLPNAVELEAPRGMNPEGTRDDVSHSPGVTPGAPENGGLPPANTLPLSTTSGHDETASGTYLSQLNNNRKSTLDPKKYTALDGYNGIYTKVGDKSGALYDRFGNQFTYQGNDVNDALLATDEDWWLPGYGRNILANISAHEDNRFRDDIYRPDELAAIGFTEEVPGHKGHWRNPSTGEIIDGNGKVYGGNTPLNEIPIHRPNSARHSNYHGMAWWYDGSRHDVGIKR